ncbi:EamA family transporter [Marinobacterium sp. D7]|uniref:EamA family transporter n=1 Tax=Marinobacterium ramblicola TaxID=2849041 RepID=UPI001C2D2CC7|nr:EamA family transporter [Marinobacterium ramblicola]MBV1787817.1 EamA family transporter [Marinobacterium ramblicola]
MRTQDLLIGLAVMCLWGANFSVIKLGVDQLDPLLLACLRFTLATFPAILFVRRPAVAWRYLLAYGVVFGIGVWGMVTWSIEAGVSAGMAGLLLQLSVVFSLLIGVLWLREKLGLKSLAGALLAILGLSVSLMLEDGSVTTAGLALVMLGAFSWSLTGVIVKRSGTEHVFAFSVWGMLFAPLPLFLMVCWRLGLDGALQGAQQLNASAWFSVLFQAYPTTLLGYWLWNRLLVRYPLSRVAPLTLLVPVFGLLGSAIFYAEQVGTIKLIACLSILAGLVVSQWQPGWTGLVMRRRAVQ